VLHASYGTYVKWMPVDRISDECNRTAEVQRVYVASDKVSSAISHMSFSALLCSPTTALRCTLIASVVPKQVSHIRVSLQPSSVILTLLELANGDSVGNSVRIRQNVQ
jgi:hypothetical protein